MKSLLIAVYEILSAITEDLRSVEWLAYNKLPESLKTAIEVLMKELEMFLDEKTPSDALNKIVKEVQAYHKAANYQEVSKNTITVSLIRHIRLTYLSETSIKLVMESVGMEWSKYDTVLGLTACKKFVEKFIL